ncbi:hypothetical protein AAFF_G00051220 [Aldrovandia affinis]|uniref:Uncharacterized protein n=1 Tax=Aldrovandia affinis TaxID=143900 RepID=A0AAD7WYU7_9TELE|nr:hypothetical protein AAFF_G00051220 [Aldrovandia affinis]
MPVTVQCLRDGQFVVVVASDTTLPRLSLESVRLLEGDNVAPCGPVGTTAAFVIFRFPVVQDGTDSDDPAGFLRCQPDFAMQDMEALFQLPDAPFHNTAGPLVGSNTYDILTNVYSSYYDAADYPVFKVLRDPVYVEVCILERTDPSPVRSLL